MQNKNCINLNIGSGKNIIKPSLSLICQIEDEVGAIPELLDRFKNGKWKISEVITLIHMMLAEAGNSYDYQELGNKLLKDGINIYQAQMIVFLELCLTGNTIPIACRSLGSRA